MTNGQPEAHRRLRRIVQMILAMQDEPYYRKDLATYFGVSNRQIQKDINLMRAAGIDVERTYEGYRAYIPQNYAEWLRRQRQSHGIYDWRSEQ